MGKKLYVGNLSYNVDSSVLEQLFSPHGTVESAQIINDRDTGHQPGCLCFARTHCQSIAHFDCSSFATRPRNAVSFRGRESSGQSRDRHNEERKR